MARKVDAHQLELAVQRPETSAPAKGEKQSRQPEHATAARRHPAAAELLATPGALLNRTHLRELGLERRAVDAVFRALPVVALPGYARPLIHAEEYLELVEHHTFRDDRVRPMRSNGG
jgi:hypothetical protein